MKIKSNHRPMILSSIHRNGKAIFVVVGLLLMTTLGYSQTGIGTTEPDPDAQLEISATNKGVLIPRIELAGTDSEAPLSSHVAGMIVYNTITAGSGSTAVVPGFYYNDGTKWVRTLGAGEDSGLSSGIGEPNATNPTSPDVGDLYIDESTGDVYAYADTDGDGVGDTWENQNDVVSGDDDNIIIPDANGLAYLSATELGIYTGDGAPNGTNPTDTPEAGDLYVDETTGDVWSYDGTTNTWIQQGGTLSSGEGDPTTSGPADPSPGDVYVDESTGDVYAYNGDTNTWENQNDVVSADANNIIVEDAGGLAYLSATELGIYTGVGAPNGTNPTDSPEPGDLYVDETTGDVWSYDGTTNTWVQQGGQLSSGEGDPTTSGPADPSPGDIYVDEITGDIFTYNSTTNTWENQSDTLANNGLSVDANNTVQLGGTLIQPTTITTDATNTLAIAGLQAVNTSNSNFSLMVVDDTTGVIETTTPSSLSVRRYTSMYTAAQGDDEFNTPQNITELENIDVYRNGVRIDFTQAGTNIIKLNLTETDGCHQGDEIRIVQLK